MYSFKDLFVIQIIGFLTHRQFSGEASLLLGKLPAQLQFSAGHLVNARYGSFLKEHALPQMLWFNEGKIAFSSTAHPPNGWDFAKDIDKAIIEHAPPMPESCPPMKWAVFEKGKLKPQSRSEFMVTGVTIFSNLQQGANLLRAQSNLPRQEFWQGLFFMLGSGQIIGHYGKTMGSLLQKIHSQLAANLQKMLGKRAAQAYDERLSQRLLAAWPKQANDKNHDPVYGTAPYRLWAKSLGETISEITSTALGTSCYNKALASLTDEESALFQELLK